MGPPVRNHCNAPLTDIEDGKCWISSCGLLSCWNHTSSVVKDTALHQLVVHVVDYGVVLPDTVQQRVNDISRASGAVVSGGESADDQACKPALPGAVHTRYKSANGFVVSDGWLVDTGCPKDLVSEYTTYQYKEWV